MFLLFVRHAIIFLITVELHLGKARARKSGGKMHPLNRKGITGRVRPPRRGQSRSARLDAEIKAMNIENTSLASELQSAKDTLAEAMADISKLETTEKGNVAATKIQSVARSRKAQIELQRRKLQIVKQQQEIEKRALMLAKRQEGEYSNNQ